MVFDIAVQLRWHLVFATTDNSETERWYVRHSLLVLLLAQLTSQPTDLFIYSIQKPYVCGSVCLSVCDIKWCHKS